MKRINTEVLKIDRNNPDKEKIKMAADVIKNGGTVAFPTETVYGLGANALDEKAVEKIFIAKGRPQDNPLIVHIGDVNQIYPLVESVPEKALKLMERFWPGPLTLLFNKSDKIPSKITGGLETVAIRMPNHKIAVELIKEANLPVAAPSANTSGKPSPTNASHVIEDLMGKIDMIIDGGNTGVGVESTVLDISTDMPTILRPGGITKEDLLEIFPEVKIDPALEKSSKDLKPKSPGQKYRHYSPNAQMIVIQGELQEISQSIKELLKEYEEKGLKVGIMATEQTKNIYESKNVIVVGDRDRPETIAANLFKVLREFDKKGVDLILAEGVEESGIGMAIMNRMRKAAGGNVKTIEN
ncbi:L-threonylcarbamoyladenylate synthase [Thermohalobacter berrensis]|uniref:Threonylcarbamoyl-AMP synthase n=1 Tax=Thermohalobacter berrensis TaxID=99594 RepID=A0A419T1F9_9FIRM|nr:L-threonylcarbamoyladenylate synthase [Thermohalobacter berrensis]RKD31394.1 threonylcarbamoyl-AMP synthase [Thermohalobacter berrensis]